MKVRMSMFDRHEVTTAAILCCFILHLAEGAYSLFACCQKENQRFRGHLVPFYFSWMRMKSPVAKDFTPTWSHSHNSGIVSTDPHFVQHLHKHPHYISFPTNFFPLSYTKNIPCTTYIPVHALRQTSPIAFCILILLFSLFSCSQPLLHIQW